MFEQQPKVSLTDPNPNHPIVGQNVNLQAGVTTNASNLVRSKSANPSNNKSHVANVGLVGTSVQTLNSSLIVTSSLETASASDSGSEDYDDGIFRATTREVHLYYDLPRDGTVDRTIGGSPVEYSPHGSYIVHDDSLFGGFQGQQWVGGFVCLLLFICCC